MRPNSARVCWAAATMKVAESGSWHTAQGLSEEGGWVWLLTQDATRTPETQCRTGLSLAWQRDIHIQRKEKGSLAEPLDFWQAESWWAYWATKPEGPLHCGFTLQLLILLCGAAFHVEFLIAGRSAVLMTLTIVTRSLYTSGPLTQPFLVC